MKNKKIGIWGFGTVGSSAVQFLSNHYKHITVIDSRALTPEQFGVLAECNAQYIQQKNEHDIIHFLDSHDYIVPSPGIDLRNFAQYAHKWLFEVDIFARYATTPVVAITGTVGKTTVTTHINALLNAHGIYSVAVGNIGTPLLSLINWIDPLINEPVEAEIGVVELSSFQLEHNQKFAPELSIITNIYPNHLDRHTNMQEYIDAKMRLCIFQDETQKTLLPLDLLPTLKEYGYLEKLKAQLYFFTHFPVDSSVIHSLPQASSIFYYDGLEIKLYTPKQTTSIIELPETLKGTRAINWLISFAAFYLLNRSELYHIDPCYETIEHRMEVVDTINGITFINDSKATIAQSTLAAAQQYEGPIILLLGGLSKGVDRTTYIAQLPSNIKLVICFGQEAQQLYEMCKNNKIPAQQAQTLEQAFDAAWLAAASGDTVLLSPGGSSYDLFKNYEERGKAFKRLVSSRQ